MTKLEEVGPFYFLSAFGS